MSFPQTDEVVAALQSAATAIVAAGKLLQQYQKFGAAQEASLAQLRQAVQDLTTQGEQVSTLREENRLLREQVQAMRDHPAVKAERIREARAEAARLAAEIEQLESSLKANPEA